MSVYDIFAIQSSIDGYLVFSPVYATINRATVNIAERASLPCDEALFSGNIPKSDVAGSHSLMDLNAWSPQGAALFERIRSCGLLGGSASLGVGLEVFKAQASPRCLFLPAAPDVNRSAAYLCAFCMIPAVTTMG